jgi:signal transduction histidine kinase
VAAHGFRRRQILWVSVNLGSIVALLAMDVLIPPSRPATRGAIVRGMLTAGAVAQFLDLLWLAGRGVPLPPRGIRPHVGISIGLNLLLAFGLAIASPVGDIQCVVLTVPAIVAAAFRFSLGVAVSIALLAGLLTLLPPGLNFAAHRPLGPRDLFNACVLALIDVTVAVAVWLMSGALREEAAALRASLRELRRTRDRLVAEEKLAAVGRLAAGVAHEIRNPVAMIVSSLDLAARDATPPATRDEMSQIARTEAARLTELTDDFLTYARGKPPELKRTTVAELLGYVEALARARAGELGVVLRTDCADELTADLDEFQLQRALLNLVSNALDATPAGGTITLAGRGVERDAVELYVENMAGPIPAAAVPRLFEPFFTTRQRGTGLGLPIAARIMAAHGGELVLAVNEPGRVRFAARLPARGAAKDADSPIGPEGDPPPADAIPSIVPGARPTGRSAWPAS